MAGAQSRQEGILIMAALTKARSASVRMLRYDKRPLAANAKVFKGALAVCDTASGYYKPGAAGTGLIPVGRFYEDVDNSGGAAGAKSANVQFFRDRVVLLLDNDTATTLLASQREQDCFMLDDHTVTGASQGNSRAGIIYDVTPEGVWVEIALRAMTDVEA
jgi:hypothetical protein